MTMRPLLHPDSRVLSDFVDGELADERARHVVRHLAACARCRDFVWSGRRTDAIAQDLDVPSLPARLRKRVLARIAAGETVILPTPAVPPRESAITPARALATAVAVVVLVGIGVLALGTRSVSAEASELRMTPESPVAGDTIRVEYRATSRMSEHDVLRVRARHARVNSVMAATDHAVLAQLTKRRDGVYVGTFVLPEGVAYAVLAVEDAAARDVDHHGERWEVLIHGDDGVPLHDALGDQIQDVQLRNRLTARDRADEMARLYPHSVQGRFYQLSRNVDLLDQEQADALRAAHRDSLNELLAAQPRTMSPGELSNVVFYARYLGDRAVAETYRDRLLTAFPHVPASQQLRVFMVVDSLAGDTVAFWNGMEDLWQQTEQLARHAQIAFTAWQTALQWHDHDALARWGRRIIAQDSSSYWVGQAFAGIAPLREEGIELLQRAVVALTEPDERRRGLTQTASDFAAARNRQRGVLLAALGDALGAAGRPADADAAFAEAVELAWQPQLFRNVAEARFRNGDTISAIRLLARVAVDPTTPPAFVDSVRARAGPRLANELWQTLWEAWQDDAFRAMQRHTMFLATNRPARGKPRLRDAEGRQQMLDPATGELTFVAFWNRYCPPSRMQLDHLAHVARTLRHDGVRVFAITEETPSPTLAAFIAENGFDFTVLHDVDREARRTFDSYATPTYLIVDGQGVVRFESHGLEDVLRQAYLLQQRVPRSR